MFSFSSQQASPIAANMQVLVSVTKRYAAGLQQLAELNVQTVKTVFEESSSVLKAGSGANAGDILKSQKTLIAEIPEKAAAYTRHFLSIVRATEADILNETRGQFEQYGFRVKGVFEAAPKGPFALLSNFATASKDAASETGAAVVNASETVAQTAVDATADAAEAGSKH
jgi:phasin family protein